MLLPRISSLIQALTRHRFALVFAVLAALGNASAQTPFNACMKGNMVVPPTISSALGTAFFTLNTLTHTLTYDFNFSSLSSAETGAEVHGPAAPGANGLLMFTLPVGNPVSGSFTTSAAQEANILGGLAYLELYSVIFPSGEIRGQITFTPDPGASFCFGDGLTPPSTPCPCHNFGASMQGCENSLGTGGGVLSYPNGVLVAASMKPNTLCLFLQGDLLIANGVVFGDGVRCIGGCLLRLYIKATDMFGVAAAPVGGDLSITARSAALGAAIPAGAMRYYQTYYRDPAAAFCPPPMGNTFNITSGVRIVW